MRYLDWSRQNIFIAISFFTQINFWAFHEIRSLKYVAPIIFRKNSTLQYPARFTTFHQSEPAFHQLDGNRTANTVDCGLKFATFQTERNIERFCYAFYFSIYGFIRRLFKCWIIYKSLNLPKCNLWFIIWLHYKASSPSQSF